MSIELLKRYLLGQKSVKEPESNIDTSEIDGQISDLESRKEFQDNLGLIANTASNIVNRPYQARAALGGIKMDQPDYSHISQGTTNKLQDLKDQKANIFKQALLKQNQAKKDDNERFKRLLGITKLESQDRRSAALQGIAQARLEETVRANKIAEEANEIARNNKEQKEIKKEKKEVDERTTHLGVARTKDDAKQLKNAAIQKEKFDRQLGELIRLREKHGGGELFNRSDITRGKQLSKDLLLTYKNLAKLGVLSKSDEDIVNAIIPSDPLQFEASNILGNSDPTLHKLKKLRSDIDADYQTTLKTRLESPSTQNNNNDDDIIMDLEDFEAMLNKGN